MNSNRFGLVDRERIEGSIRGVDFGPTLYVIARSPAWALLWSPGSKYFGGVGMQAYAPSHPITIRRASGQTDRNYRSFRDHDGGRLSIARIDRDMNAIVVELGIEDDHDVVRAIRAAVQSKRTLLIEGGGDPFRAKPEPRKRPPPLPTIYPGSARIEVEAAIALLVGRGSGRRDMVRQHLVNALRYLGKRS